MQGYNSELVWISKVKTIQIMQRQNQSDYARSWLIRLSKVRNGQIMLS